MVCAFRPSQNGSSQEKLYLAHQSFNQMKMFNVPTTEVQKVLLHLLESDAQRQLAGYQVKEASLSNQLEKIRKQIAGLQEELSFIALFRADLLAWEEDQQAPMTGNIDELADILKEVPSNNGPAPGPSTPRKSNKRVRN